MVAAVIEEKDLTDEKLIDVVNELTKRKDILDSMGEKAAGMAITDASKRIYDEIIKLL